MNERHRGMQADSSMGLVSRPTRRLQVQGTTLGPQEAARAAYRPSEAVLTGMGRRAPAKGALGPQLTPQDEVNRAHP